MNLLLLLHLSLQKLKLSPQLFIKTVLGPMLSGVAKIALILNRFNIVVQKYLVFDLVKSLKISIIILKDLSPVHEL